MPLQRIPFDQGRLLCEMPFGAWILVDLYNIDVAPGIWRDGVIEPWTHKVVQSRLRDGDVVVDLGANHGYYSLLAAGIVGPRGRVHAFEANPRTFSNLMRSVYFSGVPHIVELYWRALSDRPGETVRLVYDVNFAGGGSVADSAFPATARADAASLVWSEANLPHLVDSFGRWVKGRGLYTEAFVETTALDVIPSIRERPIRLLKLDIEGHEAHAILGARETIAASPHLSIVMEWYHGHMARNDMFRRLYEEMWRFLLDEQGFKVFRIDTRGDGNVTDLLIPLEGREALMSAPHCDLLLERHP